MKNILCYILIVFINCYILLYYIRFINPFNKLCNKNRYLDLEKKKFYIDKLKIKYFIIKNFKYINVAKVFFKTNDINKLVNYDFKKLPNKFVIKSNNGSSDSIIVDDKRKFNKNKIRKLNTFFTYGNVFLYNSILGDEKQYKIKKFYFIEEYLGKNIYDYKFHMFDGEIKYIQVDSNRFEDHCRTFYNKDFKFLKDKRYKYKKCDLVHKKPITLNLMIRFCKECYNITKFKFFRIDFYEINGILYFGEFTFTHGNCYGFNNL